MMSDPRRQHPVAAITAALKILKDNIITILVLFFVGSGDSTFLNILVIVGPLVGVLILGIIGWWRFTYEIVDGELHIERGIFVRKNIFMNRERIQVIDISSGLVQRLFGLVAVKVKSAGSASTKTRINAVTHDEAQRIIGLLRSSDKVEAAEEPEVEAEEPAPVYTLSLKKLAMAASTSGNFAIALSIVGAGFSQVTQFMSEEQLITFVEKIIPASIGTSLVASVIILLLVFSWVLSFLGSFIKYYGFTLTVQKEELLIKKGLFEQKELTVPFNRIQAIRIKEGWMRQPFGYASLRLESASYDVKQQTNSTMLFPFIAMEEVALFLKEVVPEYDVDIQGLALSPRALRRYLFKMVWVGLGVIIPVWLWVPYGSLAWFLMIPALFLGYLQYRDARIGISEGTMLLRSRWLSRTTALIKKYRVQSVEIQQNPFQKRLTLLSYAVTVASGNKGQTFTLKELDEEDGIKFLKWVSPVSAEENQLEEGYQPDFE